MLSPVERSEASCRAEEVRVLVAPAAVAEQPAGDGRAILGELPAAPHAVAPGATLAALAGRFALERLEPWRLEPSNWLAVGDAHGTQRRPVPPQSSPRTPGTASLTVWPRGSPLKSGVMP